MYTPAILWWMGNPRATIQSSCNGKKWTAVIDIRGFRIMSNAEEKGCLGRRLLKVYNSHRAETSTI
jgi:hypothetical protein